MGEGDEGHGGHEGKEGNEGHGGHEGKEGHEGHGGHEGKEGNEGHEGHEGIEGDEGHKRNEGGYRQLRLVVCCHMGVTLAAPYLPGISPCSGKGRPRSAVPG